MLNAWMRDNWKSASRPSLEIHNVSKRNPNASRYQKVLAAMRIRLKNFRCFQDTGEIEIKPITFLVGKNSAGKTTFLAGARYLLAGSDSPFNPFNRDPFYLGGYDQIAYRTDDRSSKNFSLDTIAGWSVSVIQLFHSIWNSACTETPSPSHSPN
jgi:hypothetical protein